MSESKNNIAAVVSVVQKSQRKLKHKRKYKAKLKQKIIINYYILTTI